MTLLLWLMVGWAEDTQDRPWEHESQAGVVVASGNTRTQTYTAKTLTAYRFTDYRARLTAQGLLSRAGGFEVARQWESELRIERNINAWLAAFLAQTVEGDPFKAIKQRYSTDLSPKFILLKNKSTEVDAESGYRLVVENSTVGTSETNHFLRLFASVNHRWSETLSMGLWSEYLANFGELSNYQVTAEPSLSTMLTNILSLKVSYRLRYDNKPLVSSLKKLDSFLTTSLVARL